MPAEKKAEKKEIELWEGYTVSVERPELLKDYDFITDLDEAYRKQDIKTVTTMLFVLIGGEKTLNDVREHIVAEKGYFDYEELGEITKKLQDLFPKASSASQKRW